MAVSDEFVDYVIDQLAGWGEVSARKMFGGAGLYCDGAMFGLIADDVQYVGPSPLLGGLVHVVSLRFDPQVDQNVLTLVPRDVLELVNCPDVELSLLALAVSVLR